MRKTSDFISQTSIRHNRVLHGNCANSKPVFKSRQKSREAPFSKCLCAKNNYANHINRRSNIAIYHHFSALLRLQQILKLLRLMLPKNQRSERATARAISRLTLLLVEGWGVGAWRYVFGLASRGSTIGFHLLWHTVELAMSTRLCLSLWLIRFLLSLWCVDGVGSLKANRIFMYFCI